MFKRTALSISYYVLTITVFYLLNDAYPSGPCNPGPGILFFLLLLPLSVILLFRNIYVTKKVEKDNLLATLIHAVACVVLFSPLIQ